MKFLHARHATSLLTYAGLKILIDPVFAEKEEYPAIPLTPNRRRNPLTGLKTPPEILLDADIILSTHTHRDHFDAKAAEMLDKNIPVVCQPDDIKNFESYGFSDIIPVSDIIDYRDINIKRRDAQHGTGIAGEMMGKASGYILSSNDEPCIYITGDTVFNESIMSNIINFRPEILIINAGSPKFLNSMQIVMNIMDVEETLKVNPNLTFVIVHLDTFNHCIETREDMHEYFTPERLKELGVNEFHIPADNELLEL